MGVQEGVTSVQQISENIPYELNSHGHETLLYYAPFKVSNRIFRSMKIQLSLDNNSQSILL